MRNVRFVGFLLLALLTASCGITPPSPAQSKYFTTKGGGFVFDRESRTASYGLTIESNGNVMPGNLIEVFYENPEGGEPFTSEHVVDDGETRFVLTSPPLNGLKAYTDYAVEIHLYDAEPKTILLGTHVQRLQSLVDQAEVGW